MSKKRERGSKGELNEVKRIRILYIICFILYIYVLLYYSYKNKNHNNTFEINNFLFFSFVKSL